MSINKLKPVPGKWIAYRTNDIVFCGYVKGVTLAGNCYVEGSISTVKAHQIIDVVDSAHEYGKNKIAGKYHK